MHTQRTLIQMLSEITDYSTTTDFKTFHNHFLGKKKTYMPHTLVACIFNITSVFLKMVKNPQVVRKLKATNEVKPMELKTTTLINSGSDPQRVYHKTYSHNPQPRSILFAHTF